MHFESCSRLEHQRCSHKPAQGNALGINGRSAQPGKGGHKAARVQLVRPYRAWAPGTETQGVALGWPVTGLWPTRIPGEVHDTR